MTGTADARALARALECFAEAAVALADVARGLSSEEPADDPPGLLTVDQTARRLGLGRTRIFDLMRSGQLASVRVGKSRRVPTTAVAAFIEVLESADDEGPASPAGPVASTSTPIAVSDSGDQRAVYQ